MGNSHDSFGRLPRCNFKTKRDDFVHNHSHGDQTHNFYRIPFKYFFQIILSPTIISDLGYCSPEYENFVSCFRKS